jgi:magnesium transporter
VVFRLLRNAGAPGAGADRTPRKCCSLFDADATRRQWRAFTDLEQVSAGACGDVRTDALAGEVLGHGQRGSERTYPRNIMDTRRASFMMQQMPPVSSLEEARQILRDIDSLDSTRLSCSTRTLMDATWVININQNKIIACSRWPGAAAANVGGQQAGMNFKFMPELDWPGRLPAGADADGGSALVPMWYFRRRGWFASPPESCH